MIMFASAVRNRSRSMAMQTGSTVAWSATLKTDMEEQEHERYPFK